MVKNNLKIRILLQTKIQQCIAAGMHPQVAFGLLRSELSDHEQIDWDALEFDEELCVIQPRSIHDDLGVLELDSARR